MRENAACLNEDLVLDGEVCSMFAGLKLSNKRIEASHALVPVTDIQREMTTARDYHSDIGFRQEIVSESLKKPSALQSPQPAATIGQLASFIWPQPCVSTRPVWWTHKGWVDPQGTEA